MSFKDLKKQSKLGSLTAKLVKEVEKMNNNGASGDDRLWKLDVDKSGNGYAVIRFLPAPEGEDLPFVKLYSHAFQGPGGWYIENSLTTLGQKDPVWETVSMKISKYLPFININVFQYKKILREIVNE